MLGTPAIRRCQMTTGDAIDMNKSAASHCKDDFFKWRRATQNVTFPTKKKRLLEAMQGFYALGTKLESQ